MLFRSRIVETGSAAQLYCDPKHPYTQALLAAAEISPMAAGAQELDTADVPSPIAPPPGCHFHPRCPRATERCKVEAPASLVIAEGRVVACHLYE